MLSLMDRNELNQRLPAVVETLVQSVLAEPRMQHLNRVLLPTATPSSSASSCCGSSSSPATSASRASPPQNVTLPHRRAGHRAVRPALRAGPLLPALPQADPRRRRPTASSARSATARRPGSSPTFFDRIPAVREMLADRRAGRLRRRPRRPEHRRDDLLLPRPVRHLRAAAGPRVLQAARCRCCRGS